MSGHRLVSRASGVACMEFAVMFSYSDDTTDEGEAEDHARITVGRSVRYTGRTVSWLDVKLRSSLHTRDSSIAVLNGIGK